MVAQTVSVRDSIVLIPKQKGSKICLIVEDNRQKISGLGVYNPIKLKDIAYGKLVTMGRNQYWILPATTKDQVDTITRKAQIILPKDAALLVLYCDIKPGSKVVEGGLGSGALTIALLNLVGNTGKVTSYEMRAEFAKIGSKNIQQTNLMSSWELKLKDISKGISEKDLDAVILDIPEPWTVVEHGYHALRQGGVLAGYLPTMNQVERFVNTIKEHPFIEIRTYETLQRELIVGPGGVRPSFDMLGHTGYITVARKVAENEE